MSVADMQLLESAQAGDEGAFAGLVERYRGELHAHCYRMLGSVHDADDAMQDALLRAWKALPRFEGRSSLRSWLYRIATNTCLDLINKRPKRMLPLDYGPTTDPADGLGMPLVESVWVEPYPDAQLADGFAAPDASYEQRESVELAFIAALQHLPARQRAVLISREVLGFSAKEVADLLDTTVASVNSALQRARKAVDEDLPEQSQQETLRTLGDEKLAELVGGYMDAMARGDVDRVVGMLADDAAWSMPPLACWFSGAALPEFLALGPLSGTWKWTHRATSASGQATIGSYTWQPEENLYRAFALDVLTLKGDKIKDITSFINRSLQGTTEEFYLHWPAQPIDSSNLIAVFERFGLPETIS